MRVSLTTLLIVSCCIGAGAAQATLIALETQPPLVNTSQVRVQFKGQEGTLEAKSKKPLVTIDFSPDGNTWYSGIGSFSLMMHVNSDDGTLRDNPFIEAITQPIAALNMIVTPGALDSNPCPVDFSKSWSKQGKGSGLVGIGERSTMGLPALRGAGPDPSSPPEPLAIWAVPSS